MKALNVIILFSILTSCSSGPSIETNSNDVFDFVAQKRKELNNQSSDESADSNNALDYTNGIIQLKVPSL